MSVVAAHRLSSCGAQAKLPCSMCNIPGPGFNPISPALAGRFVSTGQLFHNFFVKMEVFFSFGMYVFLVFEFFNLFKIFPLKDTCFTEFCCFLSNMNKSEP